MPGEKQRKILDDYLTAYISGANTKWVTDSFTRSRRIALYGIDIAIVQHGKKLNVDPVIPCAGPLADLVRRHPSENSFKFDRDIKKWVIFR